MRTRLLDALLFVVFFSIAACFLHALDPTPTVPPHVPPPAVPGAEALLRAETLVYSERGSREEIERTLEHARTAFRAIPEDTLQAYWEARAVLLLGSYLNHVGNTRHAADVLPEGFELIHRALAAGEFSDGLRILADLHSQMTIAHGSFYMIRHGKTTRDAARRARRLAPDNIRALITVAGFYLNAPRMAGGDTERGIERLEHALALEPVDENDRFMIYVWLTQAYNAIGRPERAREYLRSAKRIYPDSGRLREMDSP